MSSSNSLLITGAGGQVGKALRTAFSDADFRSREELDVTDAAAVERAMEGKDVVIHLAALTDVDGCEANPDQAMLVNARGTEHVVMAARARGARVIYLSTDYVFPGDDPTGYREDDDVGPVNAYGRTKLAGEHSLDPYRDLIVRTSWLFGDGKNFLTSIVAAARRGSIRVVDDQIGRPTSAAAVAEALGYLTSSGTTGIVHVAGDGEPCSWADLAELALKSVPGAHEVIRVDTATYRAESTKLVAPRPACSTLRLDRARSLGVPLIDWRTSVADYMGGLE